MRGKVSVLLVACIMALAIIPLGGTDGASMSGHAVGDGIEITYISEPNPVAVIILDEKPAENMNVIWYTTGEEIRKVENVEASAAFAVSLGKALLEQTYTFLLTTLSGRDVAQVDVEIGYFEMCTVTLQSGTSSGETKTFQVQSGGSFELPENTFTAPSGQVFSSWKMGSSTYQPHEVISVISDLTITAQWTAEPSSDDDGFPLWIIIVIVVVLVVLVAAVVFLMRNR